MTLEEKIKKVEEEFEKKFCGELGIGNWTQSWADEIKTFYRSSLTSIYEKGVIDFAKSEHAVTAGIEMAEIGWNKALDAVKEGMPKSEPIFTDDYYAGSDRMIEKILELIEKLRK